MLECIKAVIFVKIYSKWDATLKSPSDFNTIYNRDIILQSVCSSGLRFPMSYSLLGGGIPIPEQRLYWTLYSVPY